MFINELSYLFRRSLLTGDKIRNHKFKLLYHFLIFFNCISKIIHFYQLFGEKSDYITILDIRINIEWTR